jgi:phosphoribosylformylglycinamidine synthase
MIIHRIEVGFKEGIRDALGESIKKRIIEDLDIRVNGVKTIDVYTVEADLSKDQLIFLGENLFIDPVIQEFTIDKPLARDFDWLIEAGFKPGVTDNVARTAKEAIGDILKREIKKNEAIYTSKKYLVSGKSLKRRDLEEIAQGLLANDLIQNWWISDYKDFLAKGYYIPIPKVRIPHRPTITRIDLNVSDEELLKISQERKLALSLLEMKAIKDYFLNPEVIKERHKVSLDQRATDAELEVLGQTWSEHCKHKIFNAKIKYKDDKGKETEINSLFNTYIKSSTKKLEKDFDWVLSTLWDNSGVISFNKDWLLALKCETHNSPSNEEPYGGALTGIVGVYRDPMGTGQGSKLIYGTYGFCTGNPFYKGKLQPRLHPKRLLEGVRKGVEAGGNKHGVPTVYGVTFFDIGFMGKPAIYVLAAGLIPAKVKGKPGYEKRADSGDLIVMCGGRVGIDGIHGATESSMEAGEWITAGHVQIGDPFTQKKMHDFLNEARDLGLYKCITDNGAGGLSSSVGETAQFSNGFELEIDKVPLKYSGLDPWQILLSESQERMTLAVLPENIDKLLELSKKHDVETTLIGRFTNSGKFHSTYKDKTVTYLDMDFVHKGVPQMKLEAEWLGPEDRGLSEPEFGDVSDHNSLLKEMLARINICSKENIVRQLDHEVQGTSVIKHLVGKNSDVYSDAVVIKPIFESNEGLAISAGINPRYGLIDTYHMTALSIDEAIRRIIAVGGSLKQIALNDNFCWPSPLPSKNNPDAKYKLAQLIKANQALYNYTIAFKTPCISGKDSMSMDGAIKDESGKEHRVSALPTLQFSAAGKIDDVRKCVTMDVKRPNDLVYILGLTRDELGGSEYYDMRGKIGLNVPKVEAKTATNLYSSLAEAIERGLVTSVHGCYQGGLAVALAQMSFAGGYGLEIDLNKIPTENLNSIDKILYSESAGRFVVTVSPENKENFEEIMRDNIFKKIGEVRSDEGFKIVVDGKTIIQENIYKLKEAWQGPFKDF